MKIAIENQSKAEPDCSIIQASQASNPQELAV